MFLVIQGMKGKRGLSHIHFVEYGIGRKGFLSMLVIGIVVLAIDK